MNRLKIIVEQTGTVDKPEYACLYVGEDGQKATSILAEPSVNRRAEYRPAPIRFNSSNRIIQAAPAKAATAPQPEAPAPEQAGPENTFGTLKPESKKKSK
jgi:hypothetical protein